MPTKVCAKCKQVLPLESFGKNKRLTAGRQSYCRPCFSEYMRDRRTPGWREVEADRRTLADMGQRRCRKCGCAFPATAEHFFKNDKCDGGIQWQCKACYTKRVRDRVVNGDARRVYDEWRSAGCVVCGWRHIVSIAAHHIDSRQKERTFDMSLAGETVADELRKCIPVCMNHHSAIHYELRNGGKDLEFDDLLALVKEKYPA